MACALCGFDRPLANSHIIPEFLYKSLYNEKHAMFGIHGLGHLGREVLQKGLREPLLCEVCEQFLNTNFENPFKRYWFDKNPLPDFLNPEGVQLHNVDYAMVKLFHLSIIFRCGVSSLPTFSEVKLGPHEQRLRDLLLSKNPGSLNQYPIFCFALVDKTGAPNYKIMLPPFKARFQGHIVYQAVFGGCMWIYQVSSHESTLFNQVSLQPNGSLWIIPERWESVAAIQDLSKLLRKIRS